MLISLIGISNSTSMIIQAMIPDTIRGFVGGGEGGRGCFFFLFFNSFLFFCFCFCFVCLIVMRGFIIGEMKDFLFLLFFL